MRASIRFDTGTLCAQFGSDDCVADYLQRRGGEPVPGEAAGRGANQPADRRRGGWLLCVTGERGGEDGCVGGIRSRFRHARAWLSRACAFPPYVAGTAASGVEGAEAEHAAERPQDALGRRGTRENFSRRGVGEHVLQLRAVAGGLPAEGNQQPAAVGGRRIAAQQVLGMRTS